MKAAVPYILQGKNIILVLNGKSHTISKDTHIAYDKIVDALKKRNWDVLHDLVDTKKAITVFSKGNVSITEDNEVYWKGAPFHNALSTRMLDMFNEGFSIEPMVLFMENLMNNPSTRSIEQLYGFLEKNSLPITDDGHFLAFKRVRSDYKDIHTATIDNSVGMTVEMERSEVDDDPNSLCSSGLHFCSESYLDSFGGQNDPVMILKINPADVVSIPTDYNGAKGRCCRYEVVDQVEGSATTAFSSSVNNNYSAPVAAWPFGVSAPEEDSGSSDENLFDDDFDFDDNLANDEDTFDLVRVYGGDIEFTDLSIDEARDQVEKNIRQKKAQLKIVKAGTDEEVD